MEGKTSVEYFSQSDNYHHEIKLTVLFCFAVSFFLNWNRFKEIQLLVAISILFLNIIQKHFSLFLRKKIEINKNQLYENIWHWLCLIQLKQYMKIHIFLQWIILEEIFIVYHLFSEKKLSIIQNDWFSCVYFNIKDKRIK